jgi:hypothetical protein
VEYMVCLAPSSPLQRPMGMVETGRVEVHEAASPSSERRIHSRKARLSHPASWATLITSLVSVAGYRGRPEHDPGDGQAARDWNAFSLNQWEASPSYPVAERRYAEAGT